MSLKDPAEPRINDILSPTRGPMKCRIPQRLPAARQKPLAYKPKTAVNSKSAVGSAQQPRFAAKPTLRPRSSEPPRPRSAGRPKEEAKTPPKHASSVIRPVKSGDKEKAPISRMQKYSTIPKTIMNEHMNSNKQGRPFITVPVTQKPLTAVSVYTNKTMTCLPDQETINRREDLELQQGDLESAPSHLTGLNDRESITSQSDKVTQLKMSWQEKTKQFERLKNELNEKQKAIMEVYESLGVTHQSLFALGQHASLPHADQLRIMNVANLKPAQLLQLCVNIRETQEKLQVDDDLSRNPVTIDMDKLFNMPSKLVATCEQTLVKRKEIIDNLQSMTKQNGICLTDLLKKIKEYNAENEMLSSSLEKVKNEFFLELNEIIGLIRKCVNDTMAAQLRNEQLTYQISELSSQKDDLRKEIHNADHYKSRINKAKVEELEKQLKEEKCKRSLIGDRLSRAEGQVKISAEHASQLAAALEQSQSKCRNLERTVYQLKEQNENLQSEFDKELKKFTESIRENTAHLEEIADAREKLQTEKEELEKRLNELSSHYNESLKLVKHEMNANMVKLLEIEKSYEDEKSERLKLEDKIGSLCSQLLESELRYKDICKQLQETESQLYKAVECNRELEAVKNNLAKANEELNGYRNRLSEQSKSVKEIESNFKEAIKLEDNLRRELRNKDEYIAELEKKQALHEHRLQESDSKMGSYEEQLKLLKTNFAQLQEDFGEFENLGELKELINQQRAKLLETTRQNGELAEALQKKDIELERHIENATNQERLLEQRDEIIKMLSNKEEEHANIIKLLRNNLEMRTQADIDLNQQLSEKNIKIESLITNLETRKQQISQLDKIILTLEEQTHKASAQKRKDQERIRYLEDKINEYQHFHMEPKRSIDAPADNLDSIFKILEDELESPLDRQPHHIRSKYYTKKNYAGDRIPSKQEKYDTRDKINSPPLYNEHERMPTKIAVDTHPKKVYDESKGDNLNRKKANTNNDAQKYVSLRGAEINVYEVPSQTHENLMAREKVTRPKDVSPSRNINFLAPIKFCEDKKCKMYKFAGHRL